MFDSDKTKLEALGFKVLVSKEAKGIVHVKCPQCTAAWAIKTDPAPSRSLMGRIVSRLKVHLESHSQRDMFVRVSR